MPVWKPVRASAEYRTKITYSRSFKSISSAVEQPLQFKCCEFSILLCADFYFAYSGMPWISGGKIFIPCKLNSYWLSCSFGQKCCMRLKERICFASKSSANCWSYDSDFRQRHFHYPPYESYSKAWRLGTCPYH